MLRGALTLLAVLAGMIMLPGCRTAGPGPDPAIKSFAAGSSFRECDHCPEMVVVPAGRMSLEKAEAVVFRNPFAIGKYPVTRGQFAEFIGETGYAVSGCSLWPDDGTFRSWKGQRRDPFWPGINPEKNWRDPGFPQTDSDPVTCVNWYDAKAFVNWLNLKISRLAGAQPYRLPGASEWEYAARGGTRTGFWCGDDVDCKRSTAVMTLNSDGATAPVGSKRANPFGLFDMGGNVEQWVDDCDGGYSWSGVPRDGGPRLWDSFTKQIDPYGAACSRRGRGGGSWRSYPIGISVGARGQANLP